MEKINHTCGLGFVNVDNEREIFNNFDDTLNYYQKEINAHPNYFSNPYYQEKYAQYYLDIPRDIRQQYYNQERYLSTDGR